MYKSRRRLLVGVIVVIVTSGVLWSQTARRHRAEAKPRRESIGRSLKLVLEEIQKSNQLVLHEIKELREEVREVMDEQQYTAVRREEADTAEDRMKYVRQRIQRMNSKIDELQTHLHIIPRKNGPPWYDRPTIEAKRDSERTKR